MRKFFGLLVIAIMFFIIEINLVYARAGGGSSGGGGSPSESYVSTPNHRDRRSGREVSIRERIIGFGLLISFGYSSVIIIKIN